MGCLSSRPLPVTPAVFLQGSFRPMLAWRAPPSLLPLCRGTPTWALWGAQAGVQPHLGLPPGLPPPSKSSDSAHDGPPSPPSHPPRPSHCHGGACHLSPRGRAAVSALSPRRPLRPPERQLSLPGCDVLPLPGPLDQRQGLPESPLTPCGPGGNHKWGRTTPTGPSRVWLSPESRCSRVLTGARQFTGTAVSR